MTINVEDLMEKFHGPRDIKTIIKVVGVGGGGGNAVNNMFREGIHDVSFALCNTDDQHLRNLAVPVKVCIGPTTTKGEGAGNIPGLAEKAALESEGEIRSLLSDGTKMVFITAGMGGGTGTGAAPVIARIAKEMGILTVGIVTIPFKFEGKSKIIQALSGVEKIGKNVDALLIVNNERLSEIYPDFTVTNAFKKADDTLTIAAKSIAEIITMPGIINLDFADVRTTMKDGGVALMSNGFGEGERRLEQAIEEAFHSPLLNSNNVFAAKKILFNISYSTEDELKMDELKFVGDFMDRFDSRIEVIWGHAIDQTLGRKIKFTVLATGFGLDDIPEINQNRKYKKEEAEEEIARIMERFYDNNKGRKPFPPVLSSSIVILTLEEMDNEQIISILEDNPTYNRDPKLIKQTRNKIAHEIAGTLPEDASDERNPVANTGNNRPRIRFNN